LSFGFPPLFDYIIAHIMNYYNKDYKIPNLLSCFQFVPQG